MTTLSELMLEQEMKVAVIKLGARITWDTDAAVGPGEAISICKALTLGGAEVHVFTKLLAKDTLDPSIQWHDIVTSDQGDLDALDVLVVINGNVNFFGGAEDEAQIMNYSIINNFQGRVAYVMCDPELPLLQIWDNVSKKPWGENYRERDINITRKDIVVLSQPLDTMSVQVRWLKKKGTAPIKTVKHFPMERFPLLNAWLPPNPTPTVDLLYGGTTRGGRRVPNLYKWYWNLPTDISVKIFGKIDGEDFEKHPKVGPLLAAKKQKLRVDENGHMDFDWLRAPEFEGMVKYCNVLPKMNTALAHLVTGDPSYEELDIIPQRAMECIAAGNLVFVDANMDKTQRIHPGVLSAFMYVKTQQELIDRLREVKRDPTLRAELLSCQTQDLVWDPIAFCESFVDWLSAL